MSNPAISGAGSCKLASWSTCALLRGGSSTPRRNSREIDRLLALRRSPSRTRPAKRSGMAEAVTDGDTALGCGSTTKVAEQVVQKWDNDIKLITKTWVFSSSIALPAAPAVLGARAGLTMLGVSGVIAGRATSAASITFGHGARHLSGIGLPSGMVERAIAAEIRSLAGRAEIAGSFWGRLAVQGQTIVYRAFVLPGKRIHVGTYYLPR